MTTTSVTLYLPKAFMQRARQMASILEQPLEEMLTAILAATLPDLDDVPSDMRAELARMTCFSERELWAVTRNKLDPAQQTRLEALLARNSADALTEAEQEELERLGDETDRLNLLKAQAYALLRWRGFPLPSLDDLAQQT